MIKKEESEKVYPMREHFISLPEDVYCHLLAVAETQGMTAADWIAAQLPSDVDRAIACRFAIRFGWFH